jgi:hypothetical protein
MSLDGLGSNPVVGRQAPPPQSASSTEGLAPGLDQIQAAVRTPTPGQRVDSALPAPSTGTQALQHITRANPLTALSKKGAALYSGLPAHLQRDLADRVGRADKPARKAIQEVLHFARSDKGTTTTAGRQAIRTTLTAVLAAGMDTQAALKLKAHLCQLSERDLTRMAEDLSASDVAVPDALCHRLLGDHNPRETFAALRDVMTAFPDDPSRAGAAEVLSPLAVMRRDGQGRLHFSRVNALTAPLNIPPGNQRLDEAKIDQIKQVFIQSAAVRYGRAAVLLEFMNHHHAAQRAAPAGQPGPTLAESLSSYHPDGAAMVAKYQRADCMSLAADLVTKLATLGIEARVAGHWNGNLVDKAPQSAAREDVAEHTSLATHTDVLIPFTDTTGKEQVMMLVPGMGGDEQYFHVLETDDFQLFERSLQPTGQGLDVGELQKQQLSWLNNLQILNSGWNAGEQRNLFGIDLLGGAFYLNGVASDTFQKEHRGGAPNADASIRFSFADVAKDPMAKTTVKIWNEQSQQYEGQSMPRFQAMMVFLRAVQEKFQQPPGFVQEMIGLVATHDEYVQQVLLPSVCAQAKHLDKGTAQ